MLAVAGSGTGTDAKPVPVLGTDVLPTTWWSKEFQLPIPALWRVDVAESVPMNWSALIFVVPRYVSVIAFTNTDTCQFCMLTRLLAVLIHVGGSVFLHQQIVQFFQPFGELVELGKH